LLWHPHIFSNINKNLPSIDLELRNIDVNENMTRFFETPHKTRVSYSDIWRLDMPPVTENDVNVLESLHMRFDVVEGCYLTAATYNTY